MPYCYFLCASSRAHILRQRASETPFGYVTLNLAKSEIRDPFFLFCLHSRIIKRREDPFRRITKNHPPMIWAPDLEGLNKLSYFFKKKPHEGKCNMSVISPVPL